MIYIELVTDPFEETMAGVASGNAGRYTRRAGTQNVRRPVRGIEIKEDTYAYLKVVRADGTTVALANSSATKEEQTADGYDGGTSNFILQSVTEQRMEKHRIIETFGEAYIMFFGESPRFLDVQAMLLNTLDFNWEAEWWHNYETYLRGTRCVEMGARCYLFYDDNVVEGYVLMAQARKSADQPNMVPLQFKFFVTNYRNVSTIGDENYPMRASLATSLPSDVDPTAGDATAKLIPYLRDADLEVKRSNMLNYGVGGLMPTPQGGFKQLSDVFRSATRSFAYSPDVYRMLMRVPEPFRRDIERLIERPGIPLRGRIGDNLDERLGIGWGANPQKQSVQDVPGVWSARNHIIRSVEEADDLFQAAINYLGCLGADIDNPSTIGDLGLGARFSASGQASYTPQAATSMFSASASAGSQVGYRSYDAYQRDPLGSVYGPTTTPGPNPQQEQGSGYTTSSYSYATSRPGQASAGYGYSCQYGASPGYGRPGYGDYGGTGFGSGMGSAGDPGFKDASRFTAAGVADARSAYDRFMKPKQDNTSFGTGLSIGASANLSIGGSPSAFSIVAIDGDLDISGGSRMTGAGRPYGAPCATITNGQPGGLSWSYP